MTGRQGLDDESVRRLRELNTMLRRIGNDPALRRRILADLRAPARVVAAQQRAAVRALPNPAPSDWKANSARNVRVSATLAGPKPNVTVSVRKGSTSRQAWLLNDGKWRHPLFGNRRRWYPQQVRAGWFDATGARAKPLFVRTAGAALDKATDELARRINAL